MHVAKAKRKSYFSIRPLKWTAIFPYFLILLQSEYHAIAVGFSQRAKKTNSNSALAAL